MFKRYPYVSTIIILATVSLSFGLYGCSLKSAIPGKPLVFHGDSGGCGGIFVFKINNDNTIGISVSADKEILNLSTTDKTFEIGKTNGLQVEILQGKDIRSLYCTDVFFKERWWTPKKLIAKSGSATISISNKDGSLPAYDRNYKTTVILKDVHFSDEQGKDSGIVVEAIMFKDVNVGWFPG